LISLVAGSENKCLVLGLFHDAKPQRNPSRTGNQRSLRIPWFETRRLALLMAFQEKLAAVRLLDALASVVQHSAVERVAARRVTNRLLCRCLAMISKRINPNTNVITLDLAGLRQA
jgi:hypothetical protein